MNRRFQPLGLVLVMATLAVPHPARAQAREPFEASGGFSYLFADVGGELDDKPGGAGFAGELAFFVTDRLGVAAEIGYNSGDLGIPVIEIFPRPDVDFSHWTLLFGPRFRIAENDRFGVGARAMVGVARLGVEVEFPDDVIASIAGGAERFGLMVFGFDAADTTLAAALGINFDLQVRERIFWRVLQPDLMVTAYGDDTRTHLRVYSGLGVRF